MTRVKILQTTMVAGQRHAKGDEVNIDEPAARNLVALGKAVVVSEKSKTGDDTKRPAIPAKAKRQE